MACLCDINKLVIKSVEKEGNTMNELPRKLDKGSIKQPRGLDVCAEQASLSLLAITSR